MTRILRCVGVVVAILTLAFAVSACGGGGSNPSPTSPSPVPGGGGGPVWATVNELRFRPLPARVGSSLGMEVSLTTKQQGITFHIVFDITKPNGKKDLVEFDARTPETLGSGWYGRGGYYPDQAGTYRVTLTVRQSLDAESVAESRDAQLDVAQ